MISAFKKIIRKKNEAPIIKVKPHIFKHPKTNLFYCEGGGVKALSYSPTQAWNKWVTELRFWSTLRPSPIKLTHKDIELINENNS